MTIDLRNTSNAPRSAASVARADRRNPRFDCRTPALIPSRAGRAARNPRRTPCAALLGLLAFVATACAALAKVSA